MPGSTVTTMPAFERPILLGGQSRRLVDLQADAVSQAVTKLLAESGLGDHAAGDRIHSLIRTPGRIAAMACSWALNTTPYIRSSLGEILPVTKTRVKSLQ